MHVESRAREHFGNGASGTGRAARGVLGQLRENYKELWTGDGQVTMCGSCAGTK
jgi:hypothetical protein